MPELPEVESVRLSLLPHLVGRSIVGVEVRRAGVVNWTFVPKGRTKGRAVARALLVGARVTELARHGKQLGIVGSEETESRALVVQLGMTGQLFCLAPGAHLPNPTHVHVLWKLDTGARLIFRDPRRFGGISVLPGREALLERWSALGPDALSITADALRERLRGSRRAIKTALLDQGALAGVGNIYADESLFRAGISPRTHAGRLGPAQIDRLALAIREVLAEAVTAGGSSLSDGTYIDADGNPGNFQVRHYVYGRRGERCKVCQGLLKSALLGGRTSVWCPRCQRSRRGSGPS